MEANGSAAAGVLLTGSWAPEQRAANNFSFVWLPAVLPIILACLHRSAMLIFLARGGFPPSARETCCTSW